MSVRKVPWILLIVLAIGLTPWPRVMAPPQSQTVHIIDTHDDGFITEAGIGIDSSLAHILDPGMDIRAFLVFREISVDFWEPLTNATLRLRTSNTLAFDADSSVTVYGIKLSDLQLEGWLGPGFVMSAPLTSASVNVNTSQFYGPTWHEIDVTAIVEELIRNPNWDGEGVPGGWAGDDIGFIILGAQDNTRYFYDYLGNPSYSADLVIHWNHAPTPPTGYPTAVFNETYRDYNIWFLNGTDDGWINYYDYTLFNVSGGEDFAIESSDIITGDHITASDNHDFRLRRANPSNNDFVLMSVEITQVLDSQNGAFQWPGHFFGHATANKNVYNIDNDLNSGVFLGVSTINNATDDRFHFIITTHKAGAWNIKYTTLEFRVDWGLRYYLNITYNYPAQNFIVRIYDDPGFTSLVENLNRTGYANILNAYGNEFAYNTESRPLDGDWFSFNTESQTGITWIVADENGTVIDDDLDDYEDALIAIEEEIGDPDPEDPDPPGQEWPETGPFTRFKTRGYFFILGFACFFGPVWFFAWRRPSGYYILVGLLIMLMGVGLIIHVGSI